MKDVLIILLLISASKAELRCSNSSETSLTFQPSADNIEGRYKVEWCTQADKNVIEWELVLNYLNSKNPSKCRNFTIAPPGSSHSRFKIPVKINLNCTVCFSNSLDLVFNNTCYHIRTSLQNYTKPVISYDSYHYVTNNFTKEHFTYSTPRAFSAIYNEGLVVLKWYLNYVPATDYNVFIWDNQTQPQSYNTTCNVSGDLNSEVSCQARLPPGLCYVAHLQHNASWTAAPSLFENITNIRYKFCQPIQGVAEASSSPLGAWRMVVAMAAVVVMVLVVWCVVRRRYVAAWQKRVRDHWLKRLLTEPTKPLNADGVILLLYARDCATFKCAAERLGALVQRATACRVIDVYSGESTRLWAPAPDEWLRLMLARTDTRVLLLQSPAGALLSAELADCRVGPALAAPLLGSLVWWRRPHAGDALLSLALRQLAAAPPAAPYKKHYVANISSLGADMAPGVTPYRRYSLPETVLSLLRDLAPGLNLAPSMDLAHGLDIEPGLDEVPGLELRTGLDLPPVHDLERVNLEPLLQQFKEAADAFTNYVREHPDYLADELLFK